MSNTPTQRGRPPTPCPRCGEGKREVQVLVQGRMLHKGISTAALAEASMSSSVTVCAKCAGQLRAALTVLLQTECS